MERQTFLFKSNFPSTTVFATYHSNERAALKKKKKLNGVPAEDLNQVFNEPRHSSAAVTGVDLLMSELSGV